MFSNITKITQSRFSTSLYTSHINLTHPTWKKGSIRFHFNSELPFLFSSLSLIDIKSISVKMRRSIFLCLFPDSIKNIHRHLILFFWCSCEKKEIFSISRFLLLSSRTFQFVFVVVFAKLSVIKHSNWTPPSLSRRTGNRMNKEETIVEAFFFRFFGPRND